jgi:hypothetical protein
MVITIIILVLIAASFAAAARYYLKRTSVFPPSLFLTLRSAIVALLLCAFFQPMLQFTRLETKRNKIPVLVDASMSMRLFKPESTVVPFLRSLDSLKTGVSPLEYEVFCFGDSLRKIPSSTTPRFCDLQSFLPETFTEKTIREAPFVLIVSDGNLSNLSSPKGLLHEKTCFFLPLPTVSARPFLCSELLSARECVPLDSPSIAVVRLRGFNPGPRIFQVACRTGSSQILRRNIAADSGYFSDTVSLRLPTGIPGRYVYAVSIDNAPDTLRSVLYFTQTVTPQRFRAKIVSGRPLLDRRFLSIALQADPQWLVNDPDSRRSDALFMFDYNETMTDSLTYLRPKGVAVFLGALPCSSRVEITPSSISLRATNPYDTIFSQFVNSSVAPPSQIQLCLPPFMSRNRIGLFCLVNSERNPSATPDTVPFLTTGVYKSHSAVAVSGIELWRMDFLPLSVTKESESPTFMSSLTAFIKEQILSNLQDNLAVFPGTPELYEHDSLPFTVLLPADFGSSQAFIERPAESNGCSVRFIIESGGKQVLDSVVSLSGIEQRLRSSINLPSLPAGGYSYKCVLTGGPVERFYSDSFYVVANRLEFSVQAQNTVLLGEFALPLKKASAAGVREAQSAYSLTRRATVTEYLEIRQSWLLLVAIIALLGLEWVLRRRKGVD